MTRLEVAAADSDRPKVIAVDLPWNALAVDWNHDSPYASQPIPGEPAEPAPHQILSDFQIRRVIAHCTDKDAPVAAAYPDLTPAERQAPIMDTFIPKGHWAHTAPTTTYPYHPEKGKDLLAEGWVLPRGSDYRVKGGNELVVTLNTTDARAAVQTEVQEQLGVCGIHLIPRYRDGYYTGLMARDLEMTEYRDAYSLDTFDFIGARLLWLKQMPLPSTVLETFSSGTDARSRPACLT